jgi:hypothetical protein
MPEVAVNEDGYFLSWQSYIRATGNPRVMSLEINALFAKILKNNPFGSGVLTTDF